MLQRNPAFWKRLLDRPRRAMTLAPQARHRRVFLEALEDRRVLAPGELDLSFGGGDGIVTTAISTTDHDYGRSVAVDSAGNYVVAGSSANDFALARYTPAGNLDLAFGGDGIVTWAIDDTYCEAHSLAVDGAGNYVAAGFCRADGWVDFMLTRYTPAGDLDLTFGGGDGIVTTAISTSRDEAYCVVVDSAGNYVVAGYSSYEFALARYTPAGVLDPTFGGGDGIVTTAVGAGSYGESIGLAVDSVGNYVVAGQSSIDNRSDIALVRYTPAGVLDLTFGGGDGVVTTQIGRAAFANSVAVDSAGNYVVAGFAWIQPTEGSDIALTRYTPDGVLDLSFGGGDGIVTTAIRAYYNQGYGVAVDGAGNYIVAGFSTTTNGARDDFALTRYTPAGVLDTSFGGGDGIVTTIIGTGQAIAFSVAVDAAGNYVVAGASANAGLFFDFALARYEGATLSATVSSGNLTVTDTGGAGKNNQLSISTAGGLLIIADVVEQFVSAPSGWTLGPGNTSIRRPLAGFTGSITINGGLGNDTLTVNLTGGDVIPSGNINFNGGGPTTGPGDKLVITGGSQGTVTYNYTNASDGNVVMSNFGIVTYTGLEPIVNSGTATDVVFNLPATASVVTLGDDGISGNGLSRLSSSPATFELTDFANPTGSVTINRGNAADRITLNALPDFNASLTLGSASSPLAAITFASALNLAANKNLAAFATGTVSLSTSSSDLAFSGTGEITLTTARDIALNSGSSIATVNGNITLSANQQAVATTGSFRAVSIQPSAVIETTGAGGISISGRGGKTGVEVYGRVSALGVGAIQVTGQGGAGSGFGDQNWGIDIANPGRIETAQGNILLNGTGGNGPGFEQFGLILHNSGKVKASGAGSVTVQVTGGPGSSGNHGLLMQHPGSEITAVSGDISITAVPGANASSRALHMNQNALIGTSGGGQITVRGDRITIQSGAGMNAVSASVAIRPVTNNWQMLLGPTTDLAANALELSDAELDSITAGTLNLGDPLSGAIAVSEAISQGNNLSLTTGAGITFNQSVTMAANKSLTANALSTISLSTAASDLGVSGTGALALTTERNISLVTGSSVTAVNGNLSLLANQQVSPSTGSFVGIDVNAGLVQATGSGDVTVRGKGGDASVGGQHGVIVQANGEIIGGLTGQVTVQGIGGGGTNSTGNMGVTVAGPASIASDGALTVVGNGGGGTSSHGIEVQGAGAYIHSSTSLTRLTGTSAPAVGNSGIHVHSGGLLGAFNSLGTLELVADALQLAGPGSVQLGATQTATIRPFTPGLPIHLGGDDVPGAALGLSSSELNAISGPALLIGNADSGDIVLVDQVTRTVSGNVSLTAGANHMLDLGEHSFAVPAASQVSFTTSGLGSVATGDQLETDVTAAQLNLTAGSALGVRVGSATLFDQLSVAGLVKLGGAGLFPALHLRPYGTYLPVTGGTLVIVQNDGSDPIDGRFVAGEGSSQPAGTVLAEGMVVSDNLFGTGLTATISYLGGSGNDIVLHLAALPRETATARVIDNQLIVTGTTASDTILVSAIGEQVRVRVGNRILGQFAQPLGIVVDGLSGDDFVYIVPQLPATIVTTEDALLIAARDAIYAGDNTQVEPLAPPPDDYDQAVRDAALLLLLGEWIAEYGQLFPGGSTNLSVRRR